MTPEPKIHLMDGINIVTRDVRSVQCFRSYSKGNGSAEIVKNRVKKNVKKKRHAPQTLNHGQTFLVEMGRFRV